MDKVEKRNRLLALYISAERKLLEAGVAEWAEAFPEQAPVLLAEILDGSRSLGLVTVNLPAPRVKIVAASRDGLRDDQVLMDFCADKAGMH